MLGPQQPTIVLIVADDRGHADPGCTGQTGYPRSGPYQLTAAGMRLTQAYNGDRHELRRNDRALLFDHGNDVHAGDDNALHNPHYLAE